MDRDEALSLLRWGEEGVAEWNWRREAGERIPPLLEAELDGANLTGANLTGANLLRANLTGADLDRADIAGANLYGADSREANFHAADLRGGNLRRADLRGADLRGADLRGANLSSANLYGANLYGADLGGADLSMTNLGRADLRMANLGEADLRRADLREANLREGHLTGADLATCRCQGTQFTDVGLSAAKGLGKVRHSGPSSIDHRTLARSKGRIPESFLRGCGLSDWEIETAKLYDPAIRPDQRMDILYEIHRLQEGQSIMYHSIFISYSHTDEDFAKKLYEDLQDNGVRCWYAPRDMRGGKKMHDQLDRAIQMQDRLLLILSAASMSSNWVKTEIANARQKEVERNHNVLFPIRLVSVDELKEFKLFDADIGIDSAREVREYHIPDFSDWKNPASYKPAFDELLSDLRKED